MKKELFQFAALATLWGAASGAQADVFDVLVYTEGLGGAFSETRHFPEHEYGTSETSAGVPLTIASGPGSGGWDHQLLVDYTEYGIFAFEPLGESTVTISELPSALQVADATASYGSISFTEDSIIWNASAAQIINQGEMVIISWNAIPAPGGLAVVGAAGLFGLARRRRASNR